MTNSLSHLLQKLADLERSGSSECVLVHTPSEAYSPTPVPQQRSPPSIAFYADYWNASVEELQDQFICTQRSLAEVALQNPLQQLALMRSNLDALRQRLSQLWRSCGIDTAPIFARTEVAECEDIHHLVEEVPKVWAQPTDDPSELHDKTARLRIFQKICENKRTLSFYRAALESMNGLKRREKRLKNDEHDARVTAEYIGDIRDRIVHAERMVYRSALDEDAILQLHRATVLEEERNARRLAGNDIKGLRAIVNGYKMKAIEASAVLPETAALKKLIERRTAVENTLFSDVGSCREAWKRIDLECAAVRDMVDTSSQSRSKRRKLADDAFGTLRDALAVRAIESIPIH